jgi:hypothetical protein
MVPVTVRYGVARRAAGPGEPPWRLAWLPTPVRSRVACGGSGGGRLRAGMAGEAAGRQHGERGQHRGGTRGDRLVGAPQPPQREITSALPVWIWSAHARHGR